jgi:hypothetical protein
VSLEAGVMCACLREGLAVPHPFPELLVLDETGYPDLRDWERRTAAEKAAHREWERIRCSHKGGFLVDERLGNVSLVRFIRSTLVEMAKPQEPIDVFPILLQKVVYNGTHVGDAIGAEYARSLCEELEQVMDRRRTYRFHRERDARTFDRFSEALQRLAQASVKTDNPIVF